VHDTLFDVQLPLRQLHRICTTPSPITALFKPVSPSSSRFVWKH
jgi:hypothetical protein